MKPLTLILILVATLFLISCGANPWLPTTAARNRADLSNNERGTIGLRQIGSQWTCFRSIQRLDEWIINRNGTSRDKAVKYDPAGQILWEMDSYPSGRSVYTDFQTIEEQLVVRFDYNTRRAELFYVGIDPVVKGMVDGVSNANYLDVLAAADSILKGWGIPRL